MAVPITLFYYDACIYASGFVECPMIVPKTRIALMIDRQPSSSKDS